MDTAELEQPMSSPEIKWNDKVKLIVSDIDETVADLYVPAESEMHKELTGLLQDGKSIFFVTGQGLKSVQWRVIDHISQPLRKNILVGHCSGAEVWGHNPDGSLRDEPFYSVYEATMGEKQRKKWRELVQQLVSEFKLRTLSTMPVTEFLKQSENDPLTVMLEDRGPQITFEVVNGYDLTPEQANGLEANIPKTHGNYDLRIPILERAEQLFDEAGLPISPRLGGIFAVDFAVKGVSKITSVKHVLEDEAVLASLGLTRSDVEDPSCMEVWGDKFSVIRGGTDRHMSEALPKGVRSIDFREEDPKEFMQGYNTVVWNGQKHLHHGLLEYLQSRHAS